MGKDKSRLERMFYVLLGTVTIIFLSVYWGKENSKRIAEVIQMLLVFAGGLGLGKSLPR